MLLAIATTEIVPQQPAIVIQIALIVHHLPRSIAPIATPKLISKPIAIALAHIIALRSPIS